MRRAEIRAGTSRYEAHIGGDLLREIGRALGGGAFGPRCALISDANIPPTFLETTSNSLSEAQHEPIPIVVPAGEGSKSLEQVGIICERLAIAGLDRSSFVVALGGGVIGDLAGFVAAIYHRGIPWANIPTTLLAMVDSCIGGKTGVNTAAAKNLIGAIHHPALVIADVDTLATLPAREFRQGFAEIIKHAIIADASLLDKVTEASHLPPRPGEGETESLQALIARNLEIKAAIVAVDEREVSGERATLNFGHTIGHAIERAAGYGTLFHGEAVSLGIVAACDISVRKAGLSESQRQRVIIALEACDLPTKLPPDISREKVMEALPFDKKFERGAIRFVVTPALGSAHVVTDVTMADMREAIGRL